MYMLQESKYFHISYENDVARLLIDEIYPEDKGVFMCRAINDAGVAQSNCDVIVQGMIIILQRIRNQAFRIFPQVWKHATF